jgi:hypothetical protein
MADQKNQGGQKHGHNRPGGQPDQQQHVHEKDREGSELHPPRPPAGQPGGPKPNQGQTRSEDH